MLTDVLGEFRTHPRGCLSAADPTTEHQWQYKLAASRKTISNAGSLATADMRVLEKRHHRQSRAFLSRSGGDWGRGIVGDNLMPPAMHWPPNHHPCSNQQDLAGDGRDIFPTTRL